MPLEAGTQRERETGREAVARPVRVRWIRREWRSVVRPARLRPATELSGGRHDESRIGIELSGLVALGLVLPARDQRVELHRPLLEGRELPRRRDEDARASGHQQCVGISRAEVDGVAARELVPRQRVVVAPRMELAADRRDRPLAGVVDEREAAALGSVDRGRVHGDPAGLELLAGALGVLVVAERGEEVDGVGELRELHGRDRAATRGLFPRLIGMHDLAWPWHGLDRHELHPLDMADDGGSHHRHAHRSAARDV